MILFLVFASALLKLSFSQIPPVVYPCYDRSLWPSFYKFSSYPVPEDISIKEMEDSGRIGYMNEGCLLNTNEPYDAKNRGVYANNLEDHLYWHIPNNTYWFNEYLHVGHVHYDIVLMQVLAKMRIDRIILQRPACYSHQCSGIGTIESFYKGYFAALFDAFNQPSIGVYFRYTAHEKEVKPQFFSVYTEDYYNNSWLEHEPLKSITLNRSTCFDIMVRRGKTTWQFGAIATVSSSVVQRFKASAYKMVRTEPKLTSYFTDEAPYKILFAYRGPTSTRYISNLDFFIGKLNEHFPAPRYLIQTLNTSVNTLDFITQLRAVAESYVVISTHGAFEGNMIYMKNSSLLIEIFGNYGNNEVHTFHRLALMFGVFYSRLQPLDFTDHKQKSFKLSDIDIKNVTDIIDEYFRLKPYSINTLAAHKS